MTRFQKICNQIEREDFNIVFASPTNMQLFSKLRQTFPNRNIWIALWSEEKMRKNNPGDMGLRTLVVSKRNVKNFHKEYWKKVIVY